MVFGLWFILFLFLVSRVVTSFGHLPFPKLTNGIVLNKFCLDDPADDYIGDADNGDIGYINENGGIQRI